jgi:branched-chain amino acid aminotransferase
MPEKVFLNGELVDADQAHISVFDTALQHGVGVFEVLRSYDGNIFRLADHIARLRNSEATLGLASAIEMDEAGQAIKQLLAANELSDSRIRLTVTGGSVRVGIHVGAQAKQNILITAGAAQPPPAEVYTDGVGVLLSDYRLSDKDPIARHKTVSYLPRLVALRAAQQARLVDAVWFTTDGYLAGGSVSNVFLIKDDCLLTPSLDLPTVPGIARKVVIELAEELQIPVREERFSLEDTLSADEMFLTNTVAEVLPVVTIERHVIGSGRVGPLTRTFLQRYRGRVRKEAGSA